MAAVSPHPPARPVADLLDELAVRERRQALRDELIDLAHGFRAAPAAYRERLLATAALLERAAGADVFDALLASACRRAATAPAGNWPLVEAGLADLLGRAAS